MGRPTPRRSPSDPRSGPSSRPTTSSGSGRPPPCTSAPRSSPAANPVTGTLAAFATLGVGFAARPIGGILGGHLGDRVGRKPVLVGLADRDGPGHLRDRTAADLRHGRGARAGAAGDRADHPGPGVRRGVGRRDPDGLRARTVAIAKAATPASCRPASRSGCCWPTWSSCSASTSATPSPGGFRSWPASCLVAVGLIIRSKVPESPVFEEVKEAGTIAKSPDHGLDPLRLAATSCAASACGSPRPPATPCRSPT